MDLSQASRIFLLGTERVLVKQLLRMSLSQYRCANQSIGQAVTVSGFQSYKNINITDLIQNFYILAAEAAEP